MKLYHLQSTLYKPYIVVYIVDVKYLPDVHCDLFKNIDLNRKDI